MTPEMLILLVLAGAFAQAATGTGLAIVAGPWLMLVHGYEQGMIETAALCLITALLCTAPSFARADRRATAILAVSLAPGAILALLVTRMVATEYILLAFGIALVALGASLMWRELVAARPVEARTRASVGIVALAGVLAGGGAYLFAAPGPMAAWGLSRGGLNVDAIRATLSVYFVVAYTIVLGGLIASTGVPVQTSITHIAFAAPACVVGVIAGYAANGVLSHQAVRITLAGFVVVSGLCTLLVKW